MNGRPTLTKENIEQKVREHLLVQYLKGADESELTSNTPLISGGIIDSISTMELVVHLERSFDIEFQPHEVDRQNLDTVEAIANFIFNKKGGQ